MTVFAALLTQCMPAFPSYGQMSTFVAKGCFSSSASRVVEPHPPGGRFLSTLT